MPQYEEWRPGPTGGTPLSVERLNEPFHIELVVYDPDNDRLVWTIGRGRAWFSSTLVDYPDPVTVYTPAPATLTVYYAYLTKGGVVTTTSAVPGREQVPLGGVTIGAAKVDIVRFDRRPGIDGTGYLAVLRTGDEMTGPFVQDLAAPGAGEVAPYWTYRQSGVDRLRYGMSSTGSLLIQRWNDDEWTSVLTVQIGANQILCDVDQVDGFHLRLTGDILQYSVDGLNWAPAGLPPNKIRAIARRT